ncbi:MAG: TrbI F-type domain-containing protein [Gammaproteobacteria bacterium]|nr:TrbI F-type domain-containing protein [Gammaproteobacteria bacterium]MDH5651256.1 TrbI F-type domain-containing protein [Gammaproteobacteria bacterium]
MNRTVLLAVLMATLVGSSTTLLTIRWLGQPRQLATLDPTVLVAEHLRTLDPKQDKATLEAQGKAFARRLDQAVAEVAQQYHVVLLVKPVVITGVPDLTEEVRRRLYAQTR